ERGAPSDEEREAWLAGATWCWLTASAAVASGLGGGGERVPDAVIEAAAQALAGLATGTA
ncbi:MAG: hypothetical protein CVU47_09985, partial [Chloroflexi bacterium HGW-Chloroflexi-9]